MNLQVGILGEAGGWKAILRQEGVPHSSVQGEAPPESYAVLVINDDADDRELGLSRTFLRAGGSILCSAKMFATLKSTTYDRRKIGYVHGTGNSLFASAGLVQIGYGGSVAWNANDLPCEDGSPTAYVGPLEGGHCVALPFDPSVLITSSAVERRSFYSPAQRLPFERVSSVNKNGVRRIVRAALQHLYAVRGLPYVHLWYYPNAAPSAFVLRIDTDYGSLGDIEHLYEFLREQHIPGSWFVDVKSQEGFLWRFAQMQGQEVGIHCYVHKTYDDDIRNHDNILKARNRFRDANLGAAGFAAPYGTWNPGLAKVVKEFRFEYSSEFSWDYDNFPSEPWIDRKTRGIPQVPVHPISIGTLRRQGYTSETMIAYFDRVIEEKLSLSEPLFFYHHPKDRYEDVLETLIRRASDVGARPLTMGAYNTWWDGRRSEGMQVEVIDGLVKVDAQQAPNGYHLRIVGVGGKAAIVPADQSVRLDEVVWKRLPRPYVYPPDVHRVQAFNPRIPITLAVDALSSFRKKA